MSAALLGENAPHSTPFGKMDVFFTVKEIQLLSMAAEILDRPVEQLVVAASRQFALELVASAKSILDPAMLEILEAWRNSSNV